MVLHRRRLGAFDVLEPEQILGRQLPAAHAASVPLFGVSLEQGLFSVVFANQGEYPLGRLGLGQCAVR